MGRYKNELIDPDVVYEPNDITLVNQTINSSIMDIVRELQISPRYEDYIYNRNVLDTILGLLGPHHRARVKVTEVQDDQGNFLCWKIAREKKKSLENLQFKFGHK